SASPDGGAGRAIVEVTAAVAASMTARVPSMQASLQPATYTVRPSGLTATPTGWKSRNRSLTIALRAVSTTSTWSSLVVALVTYARRPSGATATDGVKIGR